jgi:hypothetical protein
VPGLYRKQQQPKLVQIKKISLGVHSFRCSLFLSLFFDWATAGPAVLITRHGPPSASIKLFHPQNAFWVPSKERRSSSELFSFLVRNIEISSPTTKKQKFCARKLKMENKWMSETHFAFNLLLNFGNYRMEMFCCCFPNGRNKKQ